MKLLLTTNLRRSLCLVLAFSLILSIFSPLQSQAATPPVGQIDKLDVQGGAMVEDGFNNIWSVQPVQYGSDTQFIRRVNKTTLAGTSFGFPTNEIYNMTLGPDGNIWFSYWQKLSPQNYKIVKMSPGGVKLGEYDPPTFSEVLSPSVGRMVSGTDGRIWYSTYSTRMVNNEQYIHTAIVKLNTDGSAHSYKYVLDEEKVSDSPRRLIQLIKESDRNAMRGLVIRDYTENNIIKAENTLLTIDSNLNVTKHNIQHDTPIRVYSVVPGNDNRLWFTGTTVSQPRRSYLMQATAQGQITSKEMTMAQDFGVIKGPDNNMWAVWGGYQGYDRFARIDSSGNLHETYSYSPGPASINSALASRDGYIWFGERYSGKLNRLYLGFKVNTTDGDKDGLSVSREQIQGTSDSIKDTDGDGLDDLTESQWFPNRQAVFCNATFNRCEYPNPLQKDVYVELDWMQRPAEGSQAAYPTKPNQLEIDEVKAAFTAKSIRLHIDTGQLSGGTEVPYTKEIDFGIDLAIRDFYDYKKGGNGLTAQFNPNRYHIYRYMISGFKYRNSDGSSTGNSGQTVTGDDDLFISYGSLKEEFRDDEKPLGFSKALAGSILHELGHSFCLSGARIYPTQDPNCIFSGIDVYAGNSYPSVLNYNKQFSLIDYSRGANGYGDHNDWDAIRIKEFTCRNVGDEMYPLVTSLQNAYRSKSKQAVENSADYRRFIQQSKELKKQMSHSTHAH